MQFSLPAHVSLDGNEFTDESREPVQVSLDERSSTVELASGKIKKYVKYKAYKFDISWTNMPESSSTSIDGKRARNELKALVIGQDEITLVLDDGINDPATYTCLIENYTEQIVLRRPTMIRWSCTLSLVEIGG